MLECSYSTRTQKLEIRMDFSKKKTKTKTKMQYIMMELEILAELSSTGISAKAYIKILYMNQKEFSDEYENVHLYIQYTIT